MRRRAVACAVMLMVTSLLASADYTVVQTVFIPPTYYVGDRVELRLRIRVPRDISIEVPEVLPSSSWIEFHDVTVVKRGEESDIRIAFSSYYPGTQTLPPLKLGDVQLKDVKIRTDSLLSGGREEYRGPRGQVLLPGTRLYSALTALALTGGAAASVFLFGIGRKHLGRFGAAYRRRLPYRKLRKVIRRLAVENDRMDARAFYILLLDELRLYVSGRIGRDCRSATTSEIGRHLSACFGHDASEESGVLLSLFHRGDLVKFGHLPSPPAERRAQLELLRSALSALEKDKPEKEGRHVDA